MPFFKLLPRDADPPNVFAAYPEIYFLWSAMSQTLMNGPSPLSQGEREGGVGPAACCENREFRSKPNGRFLYVGHASTIPTGD